VRRAARVTGFVLALLGLCARGARADSPPTPAAAELRADNVAEAGDLLLPSIRRWVERGDLTRSTRR